MNLRPPWVGCAWLVVVCLVLACATSTPVSQLTPETSRTRAALQLPDLDATASDLHLVLLISVAGMQADAYRASVEAAASMPVAATLARHGVSADEVVPVTPAAALPVHTTLITGREPADHGVPADHLLGDRGVRAERYVHASHVKATTLWQLAGEAKLRTAAIGWPGTLGASIDFLLPDVTPLRRGESALQVLESSSTPWLFELAKQYGAESPASADAGPARDAMYARVTCDVVQSDAPPQLLMLHFSQTAPVLERQGPHAAKARSAFARVDAEIGRVLGCLADSGRLAGTAVFVLGDRGTLPIHSVVEPNVALEAAGLLVPSAPTGIRRWDALARSNGGSAFVYARDEEDAWLARKALEEAAEETLAFRIVSAEEMLVLGADPEAWFGLEALPGYAFGNASRGALLHAAAGRGMGGYLPGLVAARPGFVAWGRGVRHALRIPSMRQTDVAPTLARMLGVRLPRGEGRALVGILGPRGVASGTQAR